MHDINVFIAFGAGVVSFFAPCVIPLLPAYIGYVTGVSLQDLDKKGFKPFRRKMIISGLFYVLGFSVVFVLLGTAAAGFGVTFRKYDFLIQRVGGAVIMLFGLQYAGIINLPYVNYSKKLSLPKWSDRLGNARSFLVGVVFATAWSPCVGAILGAILALAATSSTVIRGASLLFVFSLGISFPFLITTILLGSAPKYLKLIQRNSAILAKIAGLLLAIIGLLLLTDTYKYVNAWIFSFASNIGFVEWYFNNL